MRHHTQWLVGVYAQDDWRALTDLTVNAGLRYEIVTVPNEVDGKITNVRSLADPKATLGAPLFNNPSLPNVAPRMGFVYSPSRKSRLTGGPNATSVRGGFGLYYEPLLYSTYGNMTFKHEPYFKQVRITNAPFPNVYPLLASGQGLIDTFAIEFSPKSTYVEQYNLNIQRAISSKLMITTGYVGSRGVHLWRESDFNTATALNPEDTLFAPVATPVRRNPNFANIRLKVADGAKDIGRNAVRDRVDLAGVGRAGIVTRFGVGQGDIRFRLVDDVLKGITPQPRAFGGKKQHRKRWDVGPRSKKTIWRTSMVCSKKQN